MTEDFLLLEKQLYRQTQRATALERDMGILASLKFDPDAAKFRTPLDFPLPKKFFNPGHIIQPHMAVARKLDMINVCIAQLQTAVTLIEAQQTLINRKVNGNFYGLPQCNDGDIHGIVKLQEKIDELRKEDRTHTPLHIGIVLEKSLASAVKNFTRVAQGHAPASMQKLSNQTLLEKTFDARLDFAGLTLDYSGLRLNALTASFEDAVQIKTALRRKLIMPNTAAMKSILTDAISTVYDGLGSNHGERIATKKFLGQIYEMGDNNNRRGHYAINRYEAVSIRPLTEFGP